MRIHLPGWIPVPSFFVWVMGAEGGTPLQAGKDPASGPDQGQGWTALNWRQGTEGRMGTAELLQTIQE